MYTASALFRKLRNWLDTRVKSFLTIHKPKSLRVQAWADIIHLNREIKEIFEPEKFTFSTDSEHKSA